MCDYHINIFYSEEDWGYIADIPDLELCSAFGETPEQALTEVEQAKKAWLRAARKTGEKSGYCLQYLLEESMQVIDPRKQAYEGLNLLKKAILALLEQNDEGLTNAEIANLLDIRSDYQGAQKDYLSWSVLGLLLNEGKIIRRSRRYFLPPRQGE
jgi:predicted RNase H-like HicB family nuclease